MFENNDRNFDPITSGRSPFDNEPAANDMFSGQETQQSAGGSYYSPRSGNAGSFIPPTGGPRGPYNDRDEDDQPKKKAHKGLKAIAVFASVAFVAYASIQCYQFATENDSVRSFLGKQNNSIAEQSSQEKSESSESASTEKTEKAAASQTESSAAETLSFFDLAARENAMSIPDIVDKITPATVGVASTFVGVTQSSGYSMFGFGGFGMPQNQEQKMTGTGTGIIMSDNRNGTYYIITNAHVIYDSEYDLGVAQSVQVVLNPDYYSGDTEFDAEIVGYDTAEDLAVLKISSNQDLTVAEFGDSNDLRVGELVVAIGNPLGFELFGTVSTGIVSALDREVTINDSAMRLIQTDTAINNGNSGGPLINSYGQVIGINSSKISSSYSSVEGLCFAIPISHAKDVINDLINYGYVKGKPMMGINVTVDIDERDSQRFGLPVGVYIRDLEEGGAADIAGMHVGDVIIAINGKPISTYNELKSERDNYKAGDTITVTATRNGQDIDFQLTLQEIVPVSVN